MLYYSRRRGACCSSGSCSCASDYPISVSHQFPHTIKRVGAVRGMFDGVQVVETFGVSCTSWTAL
jgi:hypothetical protein